MPQRKTSILYPTLVTTIGIGWLLTVLEVNSQIFWIPVLCMAVGGVLVLAVGGIDKGTVVAGPLLMALAGFAYARQSGLITVEVMLPSIVTVAGVLMFVAYFLPIPFPEWLTPPPEAQPRPKRLRLEDLPKGEHPPGK